MHFVDIGQRVILFGEVADVVDGRDVAVHGIDGLEQHDFRRVAAVFLQQAFQMLKVVMAPDPLRSAALADALDHGVVVFLVGENHRALEQLHERRNRGLVRDVAGGEKQRGFLAVQAGEFSFQLNVIMGRAGNVARAAGACANPVDRLVHGLDDGRVLAHAEIIVRAPDRNRARSLWRVMDCSRELPLFPQNIGKYSIPPFGS